MTEPGLESEPRLLNTLLNRVFRQGALSDLQELCAASLQYYSQVLHMRIFLLVNIYCNPEVIRYGTFVVTH